MPLRQQLLDLCKKIQEEQDREKLQVLLDELGRTLAEEKAALDQAKAKASGDTSKPSAA